MRPRITRKRRAAIGAYVMERAETNGPFVHRLIDDVLKCAYWADDDIYKWLARRGYKWNQRVGMWIKQKAETK